MKPKSFMLIAGEASGDLLGAELVRALREEFANAEEVPTRDYQPIHSNLEPRFFGAGGARMAAAGVELEEDMIEHSVLGISDVAKHYLKFRRIFNRLFELAVQQQPDVIICIDFSGFNRRFAHAIRQYARQHQGWFHGWKPKIVQYVSPQVWASREYRVYQMAQDLDLVLSILPFEREWYAKRVPQLRFEFVGHPVVERYAPVRSEPGDPASAPLLLLLPGSRRSELTRHLPVMLDALSLLRRDAPKFRARIVLPDGASAEQAKSFGLPPDLEVRTGLLGESLAHATVALAKTGTVTLECAWFGVPTVAFYKTSWINYQIARQIASVPYLAMPNLLANEEVFPEFLQNHATSEYIARAALELLRDEKRRTEVKARLADIVGRLGAPGASRRAAKAIVRLLEPEPAPDLPAKPRLTISAAVEKT